MSLYIGNLSQRVRKEELERVFQRFGRCTVQVKDGYGFAVYGIRAQAETALRQLRGKRICGAILTLSWSNKQPRPLQPFARDGRMHNKMHGGRGFFVRNDGQFPDRQRFNGRQEYQFSHRPLDDGGGGRRLDSAERERLLPHDHEGQEDQSHRENFQDSGDNSIDRNGFRASRWDDEGEKESSDNEMEFERYEPDHDSEEKAVGNLVIDSQVKETERIGELDRNHFNARGDIESCSVRGSLGHNIPHQDASESRIFEDSRNRARPGMEFTEPKLRARELSRNGELDEQYRSGSRDSGYGNPSSAKRHVQGGGDRLTITVHDRKEVGQKRKQVENENDNGIITHQLHGKRVKKSAASSHKYRRSSRRSTSASTSSELSSSASSSLCRSRSMSSSSYGPRSKSRSGQKSRSGTQKSRSNNKARPKSNSPAASLSLSVSLHQPAGSSQPRKKPEIDLNGPIVDIDSVETQNGAKTDHRHHQLPQGNNNNDNCSGAFMIPPPPPPPPLDANHQYSSMPVSRNESEYDDQPRREAEGVKMMAEVDTLTAPKVSTQQQHSDGYNSSSISCDELLRVMKHYNLECSVEGDDLSTEEYFGCSRLWPWGIIYYRRLKKGAVSTENYARRLAQNQEYRITDRYVRSSSGWGEPRQGW